MPTLYKDLNKSARERILKDALSRVLASLTEEVGTQHVTNLVSANLQAAGYFPETYDVWTISRDIVKHVILVARFFPDQAIHDGQRFVMHGRENIRWRWLPPQEGWSSPPAVDPVAPWHELPAVVAAAKENSIAGLSLRDAIDQWKADHVNP